MGNDYEVADANCKSIFGRKGVYDNFRCGLAHEYYVKQACTIYMEDSTNKSCGIGIDNGRLYFVVEKYYIDMRAAVEKLELRLYGRNPPVNTNTSTSGTPLSL